MNFLYNFWLAIVFFELVYKIGRGNACFLFKYNSENFPGRKTAEFCQITYFIFSENGGFI